MAPSTAHRATAPETREEQESLLHSTRHPAERGGLLLKLVVRTYRSDFDKACEYLEEGTRIASELGDLRLLFEACCLRGDLHSYRGEYRDGLLDVEKAEEILPERERSPAEQARLNALRGKLLASSGRRTEAIPFLHAALNTYRATRNIPGIASNTLILSSIYGGFWMYEQAMLLLLEPLAELEDAPPSLYQAVIYNGIGTLLSMLNDHAEAAAYFRRALEVYRAIGDRHGTAVALMNIGSACEEQRLFEESLQAYMEALPMARNGEPAMLATLLVNIGTVYEQLDRPEEALACELEGLAIGEGAEGGEQQYRGLRCLGRLYAGMGRFGEAEEQLQKGLERAEAAGDIDMRYQFHGELATCYRLAEKAGAALHHAELAERLIVEKGTADALGKVVRLIAQHELRGLQQRNRDLAEQAARLEETNRQQAQELTAAALYAARKQEILNRLKKLADATPAEDRAELVPLLRNMISAETKGDDGEGWRRFREGFGSLHPEFLPLLARRYPEVTPTELKIAALLKIGLSTKELADVLCISLHTANTHRRRLRRKLGLPEGANLFSFLASL